METKVSRNRLGRCGWLVALMFVSLVCPAVVQAGKVRYVDARVEEPGEGQSWATAFGDLQQALKSGGGEIRMAQGIYTPTEPISSSGGGRSIDLGQRDWSFHIRNSITIKGGYAGVSESDPNTRDPDRFPTILSGDHLGNDQLVSGSDRLAGNPWKGENSLEILSVAVGYDTTVTLDGLVVQGATDCACRIHGTRVVVKDCVFRDNANAGFMQGAGAICSQSADLVLDRCTFIQNVGLQGGAIYFEDGNLTVQSCWFQGNVASVEGGAFFQIRGTGYVQGSTFIRNESQGPAGVFSIGPRNGAYGIDAEKSFVVDRCRFLGNAAYEDSICSFQGQNGRLDNCLFSGNLIVGQGAILHNDRTRVTGTGLTFANNWAPSILGQYFVFNNCIFWDEQIHATITSGHHPIPFENLTVNHCNVRASEVMDGKGNISVRASEVMNGKGNISVDPGFVDPLGHDGAAGTEDDDFRLQIDSACINAGSNKAVSQNLFDLDGQPRINHLVDMGAYESWRVWHVNGASGADSSFTGGTANYPLRSIQRAIDMARDGDSILVHPGFYRGDAGDINFRGKALQVKGLVGPAGLPVITISHMRRGGIYVPSIVFDANEGPDTVMEHFILSGLDKAITLSNSSPTLRHLTLVNNKTGIQATGAANPVVEHCILWDNSDHDLMGTSARFSCIQRITEANGEGNLSQDPLFAEPNQGDYSLLVERDFHLLSSGGRYSPTYANWVMDTQTSPCVSAGDPNTPLAEQSLSYSAVVNMGAYGATTQASRAPRFVPVISFIDLKEGDIVGRSGALRVDARDMDGQILAVEFLHNGQRIGVDTDGRGEDGWAWDLRAIPTGPAALTARAIDDHGLIGQVTIHVTVLTGGGGGR